ncbi:MAG: hypothetical protein K9K67_07050 [Bacteriovoracaceae bacterium]|nr:hypothetical protein [Bacteriovoracaceae bacterium]
MKTLIFLIFATVSITLSAHVDDLVYGEYGKYFELGKVDFYRSAGKLDGKTSDFDVIVKNNYGFEVCLVPSFELIKNARVEFYEPSFILPANSEVELGHYGAVNLGKSWHAKWDYLISVNLENCAI